MVRDVLDWDHLPVTTRNLVTQFILHGDKELCSIRLLKGMSKSRGVGVGGDKG